MPTIVDLSTLDTIAGAIAGLIVCLIVFFLVGGILLRYKIVSFANGKNNPTGPLIAPVSCPLTPAFMAEHYGIAKDLGFLGTECKSLWLEVKDINKRQILLRENLPKDYVSRDDLIEIRSRLKSIDDKLNTFYQVKGG